MANIITLCRLLLLFLVLWMVHWTTGWLKLFTMVLLIVVFVSDTFDGYIARKQNETSAFGAMFDIAADRIVELSLWVVYARLEMVPVWMPVLFVVRGSLVDAIRAHQTADTGKQPFEIMKGPITQWLVAGRFMRGFYAAIKGIAFCWLLLNQGVADLLPSIWKQWGWLMTGIGVVLIYSIVILCLLRGLPVIMEFSAEMRHSNEREAV